MQAGRGDNEPLLNQYERVRGHSEALCAPLAVDDYGVQPVPDVSPPKWHLAHTSWFFETFLLKSQLHGYRPFDDRFEVLFNSYYNGVGAQHPRVERGHLSRPTVAEIYEYRAHVDGGMANLLTQAADNGVGRAVVLGMHHEQQHQELLMSDIKYILGQAPLQAAYDTSVEAAVSDSVLDVALPAAEFVSLEGGLQEIGVPTEAAVREFSFDNETPRHKIWLEPFELASRLVTNAQFLEFVNDGGYTRSELWLSEGWAALQAGRFGVVPGPLYWRKAPDADSWHEYRLTGPAPLVLDAPVAHVSYYEADAYARWCGARLPTEAEWETAATSRADALHQLHDSLWQWTASAYLPYPGFEPLPGTLGEYNGKFMSGQMVLRGGSLATPSGHLRATYRNFFYPPDRWQFTGIRLARGLN